MKSGEGVKFEDIPFSEIEAQLFIEGMGAWRSLDDIEDNLVLDELLLLHDALGKSKHMNYRMLGSLQGVDIGDYDSEIEDEDGGLPEEIIAMEREFAKKKEEYLKTQGASLDGIIGYKIVDTE